MAASFYEHAMTSQNTTHYDALSRAFHWVPAIVVTIAFILGPGGFGRLMHNGIDPSTRSDIVWHETLGLVVFGLTVLRLLWVAFRPAAPQIAMAGWMHLASKGAHLAFWVMMLVPLSALVALGTEGHPLTLFGGLRVDQMPIIANSGLANLTDWGDVHGFLGDAIIWLAGLHAVAEIYHHVILKDGVLKIMLPRRAPR